MNENCWVPIQEAADEFAVSTKTIRRWISAGDLEARRFGPRLIRVRMSSLQSAGRPVGGAI